MHSPTKAEIRRALRGPLVPCGIKGCEHVLVGDVPPGRSVRTVSVLALAFKGGRIAWATRFFMTPIDPAVIALRAADQWN